MLINYVEVGLWEALKVLTSALAEFGAILLHLTGTSILTTSNGGIR